MSTIKSHVRCLTFNDPFLLAGIGSFVFIWYRNDKHIFHFIRSISFKMKQNIIGIRFINTDIIDRNDQTKIEHQLIIYSIHYIYYCSIHFEMNDVNNLEFIINAKYINQYMILDLINDTTNNESIIMINARNEVVIQRNLKQNQCNNSKQYFNHHIFGPQKCILYSAKILESSLNENYIIIASGTVFTQILIWSIVFQTDDSKSDEKPLVQELQTLHGHDGVIFSIDYNSKLNILVTASDDRSIRIWSNSCNFQSQSKNRLSIWKMNRFQLTHTYYGHEARIWRVMIVAATNTITDSSMCISVGEDSSLIIWSLHEPFGMLRRKRFARNNRIWSLCTTDDQIICGGSDGSIQFTCIEDILQLNRFKTFEWSRKLSSVKAISFLRSNISNTLHTLTACVKGEIFICDNNDVISTISIDQHQEYNLDEIFGNYIKMAANHSRNMVVIGSIFGHLGVIRMIPNSMVVKLVYLEKMFEKKIIDISFIDDDDRLMICLLDGLVKIVQIYDDENCNCRLNIGQQDYRLPNSKHQWCSCGLLYKNLFIIGDYSGNILSYWSDESEPFQKLWHIHGQNGVTCIRRQSKSRFVYSSGRNGRIIEYIMIEDDFGDKVVDFRKLRTYASFYDVEWICGFEFDSRTERPSFVYGFNWRKFIVWNIDNDQTVLFEEDCGGGHRSFDVFIEPFDDDEDGLIRIEFSFSKSNTMKQVGRICHHSPLSKSKLCFSSIPRKINCCTQMIIDQSVYFMIAGEDRSIQVIGYEKSKKENHFNLIEVLHAHIATVNAIRCLSNNDTINNMTYAISVGSRSQMIIWRFWHDDDHQRLICEEKSVNFLGLFNKQLEFETKIRKTDNDDKLLELDVRYMDVDFIRLKSDENPDNVQFQIVVACSDASFRIFNYCEYRNKIEIQHKIQWGNSCLLKCRILLRNDYLSSSPLDDSNITAVTTNDGYIHLCSINSINQYSINKKNNNNDDDDDYHRLLSRQIHRSSICAFDWMLINNEILMIATGGDDNRMIITLINVYFVDVVNQSSNRQQQQVRLNFLRSFSQQISGHTCQITDVKFTNENDYRNLISISIDQQMICWRIHIADNDDDDGDKIPNTKIIESNKTIDSIISIDRQLISIADVSSFCRLFIDHWNNNNDNNKSTDQIETSNWLICGDGFQLIRMNGKKNRSILIE
ncbi:LOW QUALITY PROTEIN: tRNA (34-2'-O)-methyltransferase regulator WDR6 [Dermatophagoides farinae]|uniref:LOW QUALITY PROTEIN: tRNA (34-2'-O)-methyltransferase regulator WDR6 n=1 Tax=Dermatophagoides farinae TaxID=6954 RepID=UPI003F63E61B